jgi:hypothetical protein
MPGGKVVQVVGFAGREKEPTWKSNRVAAYWLPWESRKAVAIDLLDGADYFFTSELNGCQIRVAAIEGGVRVIHVAGDGPHPEEKEGSLWRHREAMKHLTTKQGKRSRRLSSTISPDDATKKATGYKTDDKIWVNVVGFRRNEQWEIWSQIVEGGDTPETAAYSRITERFWPSP